MPGPVRSSVYDQKLRANSKTETPQPRKVETEITDNSTKSSSHSNNSNKTDKNENNGKDGNGKDENSQQKMSSLSTDLTSCRGIGE